MSDRSREGQGEGEGTVEDAGRGRGGRTGWVHTSEGRGVHICSKAHSVLRVPVWKPRRRGQDQVTTLWGGEYERRWSLFCSESQHTIESIMCSVVHAI